MNDTTLDTGRILLIGIEPEVRSHIQPSLAESGIEIQDVPEPRQAIDWIARHRASVLAAAVGPHVRDPVRLAQRIHRLDREIAVLIFSDDDQHQSIQQALQVTPFLGDRVSSFRASETERISETIRETVIAGKQRRRYRSTISAINEQLRTFTAHHIPLARYLDHVLDHAPIGVLALDGAGRVISANHQATKLLEYRERELLGAGFLELFEHGDRAAIERRLEPESGRDVEESGTLATRRTRSGSVQFLSVSVSALPMERGGTGHLAILQDVTAQVISDREREEALQVRDDFLSMAAHELKTPLTSIKGYIDLLGRQIQRDDWDQDRITRIHSQVRQQVDRLEVLVGDLLDASSINRGALTPRREPTDLVDIATHVLETFAELHPESTLHEFVLEAPRPVVGNWDGGRLEQVLTNLLSNAVKYSPNGGEIQVTVRQDGDQAELVVRDHGVGIEPELRDQLFQPFMRGSMRGMVPGSGLGLHIANRIVEQHGGTITVASVAGEGSTFTVRLPLDAATD